METESRQMLRGGSNGAFVFNGPRVSVLQDEKNWLHNSVNILSTT